MGHSLNALSRLLLAWAAVACAVPATAQIAAPEVRASLVAQSSHPAAGHSVPLAIVIEPPQGWHIYWLNPGDSGYAPRFAWALPRGATISAPRHPVPTRMTIGGIAMNVHDGRTVLVADLAVDAAIPPGTPVQIGGTIDLLVCSQDSCVPDTVHLSQNLVVGDGATDPSARSLIASAQALLPQVVDARARYMVEGQTLTMQINLPLHDTPDRIELFPVDPAGGVTGPVHIEDAHSGHMLISAALGTAHADVFGQVVLVERSADGGVTHAWQISAQRGNLVAARQGGHVSSRAGLLSSVMAPVAAAVLGGLLLNLMPCVFPILSLKAMALVRSGAGRREARSEALGYLAGAVGTMLMLGAAVLVLRAGGEAVGWAFQLQNPAVVAVLLLLVAAIAFNLAGLFELPALGFATLGSNGFFGGLGTGALAAFVATPCSGPFMAGALGAALVLPALAGLAIFAGLGFGLALPFLVIGFWEPARRRMPRPGAWMTILRHALSVPMFATALGLSWLIGQQSGVGAMTAALGGVLLLGLALWLTGARQRSMLPAWPAMPGVVAALALAVFGVGAFALTPAAARASADVEPYSAARLSELQALHRPVLVYATAAWCLTCKVNEATSLNTQTVRQAFHRRGAVMMEADWTRSNPEVTRLLTANARAGVPLYLWYPVKGPVQVLPQVLSPRLVRTLVDG